jgi:hypothetical protein
MLIFGAVCNYPGWVRFGVFLGWIFCVLSLAAYIVSLVLAIYRDSAGRFWCNWIPFNFGLTLFSIALLFARVGGIFVFVLSSVIGVVVAVVVIGWRLTNSRIILIMVNLIPLVALPFLSCCWESVVLALSVFFVTVPVMVLISRVDRPHDRWGQSD